MNKNINILLLIVVSAITSFGQSKEQLLKKKTDSLTQIINDKNTPDTTLIKSYSLLAEEISLKDPDLSLKYFLESTLRIDKLLRDPKTILTTSERNTILKHKIRDQSNIAAIYIYINEVDKAIEYFNKNIAIAEELNDSENIVTFYNHISQLYFTTNSDTTLHIAKGNIKRINFYLKGSKVNYTPEERKKLLLAKTVAQNNIAVIQLSKGNTSEALDYFLKNLKINKQINELEMVAVTLLNISYIYYKQEEYNNSIKFANEAIPICQTQNILNKVGYAYNQIGQSYLALNQVDSSFYYHHKAYHIFDSLKLTTEKANTSNSLSNIYLSKKEFSEALVLLKEAEQMNKKTKNNNTTLLTDYYLGKCYFGLNKINKAEKYLLQSLKLAQKQANVSQISKANFLLYKVYEKQNKHKEAIEKYKTYILLEDSLNNKENQKQFLKQQANFEYNIKAAADSIRQLEALKVKNAEITAEKALNEKQKSVIAQKNKEKWYLYGGLGIVLLFALIVFNRFKVTKKQKKKIELQEQQVRSQHKKLEAVHNDVQASINYAKGLQDAILPSHKEINTIFKENFILFKPKDIVSGDFYWLEKQNDSTFIAIADCTGHGIPGAMVSIVCSSALSRSVKEFKLSQPSEILDKTRELIIETFSKSGQSIQDGMDICICAIKNETLYFAGAYNHLWIIRDQKLAEYKGDRQPVGYYINSKPFSQTKIQLKKNDQIYLTTDGYHDQFGGQQNKKFKAKNLKHFLLENAHLNMETQKEKLHANFLEWKGDFEQIDDVTIMGIKVESID